MQKASLSQSLGSKRQQVEIFVGAIQLDFIGQGSVVRAMNRTGWRGGSKRMKKTDEKKEQWDHQIDGKAYGITRIVVSLALTAVFTVLTVDQLQPRPNKNMFVAFSFGSAAALMLGVLVRLLVRYYYFKVYIGREGFYFQSNPFNGKYYPYSRIAGCSEEIKISRSRNAGGMHCYTYFVFTVRGGESVSFSFDKAACGQEIRALQKRIQKSS